MTNCERTGEAFVITRSAAEASGPRQRAFHYPAAGQQHETQMLKQWRQSRRRSRLELLPLAFMLASPLRSLEATARAERPTLNSSSPSTLLKASRNVGRLMQSVKTTSSKCRSPG